MSMSEWAKREVALACKRENPNRKDEEFDYGCGCYESALKAFLSLCEDGHSMMSFGFTKNILIRLMNGCPLTPIEGNDEDWCLSYEKDGIKHYQCNRMSSLFKAVYQDGTVKYSANNYYCIDEDSGTTYTGGIASKLLNEYIEPIKMPYFPPEKKYVIHTRDYLTDKKNGDFDTTAYLYIDCPNGKRINVYRYFKVDNGMKEITVDEYYERVKMHKKREEEEQNITQ